MQHISIELAVLPFIICIFHKVQFRIQNPKLYGLIYDMCENEPKEMQLNTKVRYRTQREMN